MTFLKNKTKSEKIISVVLTVILLAFLALIFYVNLSCNPDYYDGDIYNDANYAKEAWKAKSIFPKDWVFGNQTYVVATPVLAALLCGLTGNGFTALAIASCIMTVLIVLTYDWMTRTMFSYNERISGFLFMVGFLLFKAHIATSQQGIQVFFTMASYYSCYLITAFVVYGCYVRLRQKRFTTKHIPMAVIGVLLSFGTGMQSLRQTAVMALPIIVCETLMVIIYTIRDKKFAFPPSAIFAEIVFVANIAGLFAMKFIQINQVTIYGATSLITDLKVLLHRVFYNIEYVALVFGPDDLKVRVRLVIASVFLLIILVGFVLCVRDFIKEKCSDSGYFVLILSLTLGCLSVFAAGVFTNIANRALYFFMLYPLLAVCTAYILKKCEKKRLILFFVIAAFAASGIVFRSVGSIKEIRAGRDKNSEAHQIADFMLDNGYDTIYSVFGLGTVIDGAEDVIVASGEEIHLVQFKRVDRALPMKPVHFLCVKDNYKRWDNAKSLYVVRKHELPYVEELAEKYGVKMTKVAEFESGKALYSMSENLCAYADTQE